VVGLRKLALVNMDPFSDDIEDLGVMTFVMSTFKTSNKIIDVKLLDKEKDENEEARRRSSIYGKGLWLKLDLAKFCMRSMRRRSLKKRLHFVLASGHLDLL
jgi:hypothetical protein